MELNQLPKVLVQTLDTLLDEHGLSSWQVRGGDIYTQVTLRFNMAERSTEESVYRKVSDRRLARDRDRARQWRQHHEETGMTTPVPNEDNGLLDPNSNTAPDTIIESHIDNIDTNSINHMAGSDSGSPYIEQQTSEEAAQHNQDSDTNAEVPKPSSGTIDTNNITHVTGSDSGREQQTSEVAPQHSQDSATNTEEPMSVEYDNSSAGSIKESVQDVNNSRSNDIGQVAIKCNICHGECNKDGNVTWFRCTVCDDFDICKQCRRSHSRHNMWKHRFTYPVDCEHDGYCDSCGYVFKDLAMKVYQCPFCKDYVLCRQCMQQDMHSFHGKPKAVSLADYLEFDDSED